MFEEPRKYNYSFFNNRLMPIIGYLLLLLTSIGIAFVVAISGIKGGVLIIVFVLGVPALIHMISNLKFGIIMLLIFSFFLSRIGIFWVRDFPMGTIVDVFILLMLIGLMIKKKQRNDYRLANGFISYLIWLWLLYNALQFLNPMQNSQAWIFAIRSMVGHMIFYFIVLEAIDNMSFFRKLMGLWIILALLGALYGLFQEFHGLLQVEKNWVISDPRRYNLYTIWGKFRIFSFFNDPTVYGILMGFTGLFCLLLLNLKQLNLAWKGALILCAVSMLLAVVYTGTRTAYAMLPAGFGIFALITFQKKTILFTSFVFLIGASIIFSDIQSIPFIGSGALNRVRSAFNPSDDPSYLVRVQNQAYIKPFIQSHPFGAGIGTLGTIGKRFNPNGPLTGFDADSMYVKVVVELGWIGLIIYCTLIGGALIYGIRSYFRMKNEELKVYMAAIIAVVYSIIVANYTQMVTIQLPNAFVFYILIASIVKLKEFDDKIVKSTL